MSDLSDFKRLVYEPEIASLQDDVRVLRGWVEEYERWASSMPDAGLTADDPRSAWYMRRPQYPHFRANLDTSPARIPE